MVYSSLHLEASIFFLISYSMVFYCTSIHLHSNRKYSKQTQENSTLSLDYFQTISHDINRHISTTKTSHGAEEQQQSHGRKNQIDMRSLENKEAPLIDSVNNILAAENIHGSRRVRRSQRSTHTDILILIQQYVNYFHNYSAKRIQPRPKTGIYLRLDMTDFGKWNMISSCPTNYSVSYARIGHSSNRVLLSATCACKDNGCYQVNVMVHGHLHSYPVGCVRAIQKSSKKLTERPVPAHAVQ